MKRINHILLTVVSLFAFLPVANGQTIEEEIGHLVFPNKDNHYDVDQNVAYSKQISKPTSDGTYWIKLETFTTGSATTEVTPADIVLVLDFSTSMDAGYPEDRGRDDLFRSRGSASYSFQNYPTNNTIYYYKYNGRYYQVARGGNAQGQGRFLTFTTEDGTQYYLNNNLPNGIGTTPPTQPTSNNVTCWTGTLYTYTGTQTRISALRQAVSDFITVIYRNDNYNGNILRPTQLGNRISIVAFSGNNGANGTHQVLGWTNVTTGTNRALNTALSNPLGNEGTHNGTYSDNGMTIANTLLSNITRESNRTVVLFTDGAPGMTWTWTDDASLSRASNCITVARTTKNTYGATVFSVALYQGGYSNYEGQQMFKYMNAVSSNYPNARTMDNIGARCDDDSYGENKKEPVFFMDAGDDLSAVFKEIAHQSGGSDNTDLTSGASNVDIISSSFKLDNPTDHEVLIFTAKCKTANHETHVYTFEDEVLAPNSEDTYDVYDDEGNYVETKQVDEEIELDPDLLEENTISVTGFDYSNNWVGLKDGQPHGHKIIIMIPIQMNPDAVGGPNVATNDERSGLYVEGQDDPIITFTPPTVSLPVNMFIEKEGLEGRESAKFMIERAEIPDVEVGEEWSLDDIDPNSWVYVSTVFVTNDSNNPNAKLSDEGNPMVKVRGLPSTVEKETDEYEIDEETGEPVVDEEGNPVKKKIQVGLVYRITEENWSWSYKPDPDPAEPQYTVTGKVNNPFTFKNKNRKAENIDVKIRHAESKATNIFKTVGEGQKNEIYDDSKQNDRSAGTTPPPTED